MSDDKIREKVRSIYKREFDYDLKDSDITIHDKTVTVEYREYDLSRHEDYLRSIYVTECFIQNDGREPYISVFAEFVKADLEFA